MGNLLLVADTRSDDSAGAIGSTGSYRLRLCRRSDLDALGKLYFEAYDPGIAAATVDEAVADMHATFAGEYGELWMEASPVAVDHDGRIVGAVQTVHRAPWNDVPDCPFVIELFTARDQRRRGIARALLSAAIAKSTGAGCRQIALRVEADNAAALALYTGLGFHTAA
ncbi:MAG: GNAT family N-acetyltransferase [Streptosporangiales bacterium]